MRKSAILLFLAAIVPCSLPAATLTFSASQPTPGSNDIYNWVGAGFDADNVGGSGVNADGGANNGAANDGTTYVATDRPAQGQTFATGSFSNGYLLTAFTVRMQGYTNNIATGGNIGGYDLDTTSSTFRIRVGRVSNTVFYSKWIEYAASGGAGNPGAGGTANGPGRYLTFAFKYPVRLEPNTTYGVDLGTTGDYFEWLGIRTNATSTGTAYTSGASGRGNFVATAQPGDRVFLASLSEAPPVTPTNTPFAHPGTLHTQADFDRVARKVAEGTEPWASSFNTLVNWKYANLGRNPRPAQYINRCGSGCTNNYTPSQEDAQCIYEYGLIYRISGDTAYADRAVYFMNAWSPVFVAFGGDSNFALAAGMCGYLFAIGGDLLYDYPGWAPADRALYQDMLANRMYGGVNYFLTYHNGTCGTHYRGNWDLDNITALLAIGVMADNTNIFNQGIEYWTNGVGVGMIARAVNHVHPDGIGQTEEVGRDQAHNIDEIYGLTYFSQIAWNQGFDMFGYDDNRVLRGLEQTAKYNLFYDILNQPHRNCDINYTETVSSSGRGSVQTGYEMVYNHYEKVIGTAAPWSKVMADSRRPEVGPDASIHPSQVDWVGFGTLMYTLDTAAPPQPPTSAHANWTKNHVQLYWTGTPGATNYLIQRATAPGGPYTTLATIGSTNTTYIDSTAVNGSDYFYIISTGATNSAELAVSQKLVTRYAFEGNLNDSAGTNHAGGAGNIAYGTGFGGGQALNLNGSNAYVQLPWHPAGFVDVTLAAWVNPLTNSTWARVFDFGSDTTKYLFLTPRSGSGTLRFSMTTTRGYDATVTLDGPALSSNAWTHVAVSINGDAVTLYTNGVPVAWTNTTIHPIFAQPYSWIGKSQFSADPLFAGRVDDFRIYNYGLTGHEIWNLWGQNTNAAPIFNVNPFSKPDATQGVAYAQSLAGSATGGTLTYSKVVGPAWLNVAGNGALTGTPGNSDVGTNTFVVRVTNQHGATDDATLNIVVINVNDAPTWTASPFTRPEVTRGVAYSGTIAGMATDVDAPYGDSITYSKLAGPAWLNVATNGALTGTPGAGDVGLNSFTVRVTDTSAATADATLNINVLPYSLRSHYQFDNTVADTLGNNPGIANGSLTYTNGKFSQAISLDGSNAWVNLSQPLSALVFEDITVAAWVWWNGGNQWQRIFDFGNDTTRYMFLSPRSGGNTLRFAIKNGGSEQIVETAQLPSNQWIHLAVTLGGTTGRIYTNGLLAATNPGITINPSDFAPANNLIGDSQFSADPFFAGRMDDFRLYNYALDASEIAFLYTNSIPEAPTGLTATPGTSTVSLNWNASAGATQYVVKRALVSGGPYTVLATNATTSYTDTGLTSGGTRYYVVSAIGALGESPNSAEASALVQPTLHAWLKFDEGSGTFAADSTGHGWNGTLVNGASFVAGYTNNAVSLAGGSSQYVRLPAGVVTNLNDFSIACWVKLTTVSTWMRVFDFGSGTTTNMFFTPQSGGGTMRFAITTTGNGSEQRLNGTNALPTGVWKHLAVTLIGTNAALYVDGSLVSTTNMTLHPADMGITPTNYIGRSQYADPYLNGLVDDFRIYSGGLSAGDVATFLTPLVAPTGLVATGLDQQVALSWNASTNASSYTVLRSLTNGGPYTQVANVASTVFTNTGLTNGITYYYVVQAANAVGQSGNSAQVSATPQGPPGTPTGLLAVAGDSQVALTWNAGANAESYNVKRSIDSGGPYTNLANVVATGYADTTALNGSTYYYVVSTVNSLGESADSDEANATPLSAFAAWQLSYFGCSGCPQAAPDFDADGDGLSNTNEFLAGFNPTNGAAHLRILSVAVAGDDIVVTYLGAAGDTNGLPGPKTNLLEFAAGAGGRYTNAFASTGQTNILNSGTGLGVVTNAVDSGGATNAPARYYRVRVAP
jgi:hypothetical protein